MSDLAHPWSVTAQEAIAIQRRLHGEIRLEPLAQPPQLLAGADLSYEIGGSELWAAIVLLEAHSLAIKGWMGVRDKMRFPYVPGLLSFREIPALMKAWAGLEVYPDLIMVDGHGIAHPRRLGIATHLGLLTGTPSMGCGKSVLVGSFAEPGPKKGSFSPMEHQGEQVGYVLRTRDKVKPMYISPGHKIDLEGARHQALAAVGKYRMPEPTRQAHLLVNRLRRGEIATGFTWLK